MYTRLFQEAKVVLSNIKYIPSLFTRNSVLCYEEDIGPEDYESISEYEEALSAPTAHKIGPFRCKHPLLVLRKTTDSSESVYFINGIRTSLSDAFVDKTVHLIHNPTYGILTDVCEGMLGRSFGKTSSAAKFSADIVRKDLLAHKKVILLSHSNGGIISSNVVKLLLECPDIKDSHLEQLEIYTFGSGALSHPSRNNLPHAEHFANGNDYVARIGVLWRAATIFGEIFLDESRTGHLLSSHYIDGLLAGCYGKRSRLFSYIKTK